MTSPSKRLFLAAAAVAAVALVPTALAQIYIAPGLGYFVLTAIAPTNDTFVSFSAVNADDGKFWIGKPTAQTCTTVPQICDHLDPSTVLAADVSSLDSDDCGSSSPPTGFLLATLSAHDAKVQRVYVAADGTLAYTAPGAAVPSDAQVVDSLQYTPESVRTSYGNVVVEGREWVACSADQGDGQVWLIYSNPAGSAKAAGCYTISMETRPYWDGVNVDYYNTTAAS